MNINSAEYIGSYRGLEKLGYTDCPEYAFIGRSNVGKSSLINMLLQKKDLAKTSSKPGKTQTLNLFLVNNRWNLVDLPGYGYAKAPKKERGVWLEIIEQYFLERSNLITAFLLIDASIEPQNVDLEFCDWMGANEVPFSLVFTKTDKGKTKEVNHNIARFKEQMQETWEELPPIFQTSVEKQAGRDAVISYIDELNTQVLKQ